MASSVTINRAFAALLALGLFATGDACRRESAAPTQARAPAKQESKQESKLVVADAPRLKEDPAAGKRSEQQWREHLEHEEEERQLGFDRQRLQQHRAAIKLINAARARYDHARTEAAVEKARAGLHGMAELHKRVKELDPWGVNSRLLQDYAAFDASLTGTYPDAKVAAIRGDARPLEEARAAFDQRMKSVEAWLEEAAESEGE